MCSEPSVPHREGTKIPQITALEKCKRVAREAGIECPVEVGAFVSAGEEGRHSYRVTI